MVIMLTMARNMTDICHVGMVMTKFRHDHGMITARSWHGSHVFPTWVSSHGVFAMNGVQEIR